jgi:SOS-response transcriptional repressor LexA
MTRSNYVTRSGDDIVRYISRYWSELNCSPTIRDICRAFDIASTSTALSIIRNLEAHGKIVRDPYRRSIQVVQGKTQGVCQHDWRVKNPSASDGIFIVQCLHCDRVTEVESSPQSEKPETWLRFMGEVR